MAWSIFACFIEKAGADIKMFANKTRNGIFKEN
jgi:hypothetical protein